MRLTILGGGAAWPTPHQACSGYLVEHDGHTLLVDPGYAVLPQLLALRPDADVDAVLVSHGHLDHCADLVAVLSARHAAGARTPLPVLAPRGVLPALLHAAPDRTATRTAEVVPVADGDTCVLGPFRVAAALLPHHVPTAGFRISADRRVLAYTGDSGECQERVALATGADVLLAEATYTGEVPVGERGYLSSSTQAVQLALAARVEHTILTHHRPGEAVEPWLAAARVAGLGNVLAASAGMSVELGRRPTGWTPARQPEPVRASAASVLPRRAAG